MFCVDVYIFLFIVLIASILQTSTGFGFSILATPFLLLLFAPFEAIQINLFLSLCISLALIVKIRKDVDYDILKRLVIGSVFGLPLGLVIFLYLNLNHLKLGVGALILLLTFLLILRMRFKQNQRKDIVVGGLSGMFTTSIGMPGPPLLLYFSGTDTKKEQLRATTLAFYLWIYLVSLIMQLTIVGTSKTVWTSILWGLPFVCIGLYLGQRLFYKMNQAVFQIIVYIILLFTGIYTLLESLGVV